jgi:peptidoglycan lytic transglycosylase G
MMRAIKAAAALVALAILVGAAWFVYAIFGDKAHPDTTKQVIVQRGSTFHEIASQLAGAGIIGNEQAFRLYAKFKHADTAAHAGEFRFAAHQTAAQVLAQLESGGAQIAKWVTIPEGFTAKQIAQRLQDEGFGDAASFRQAFLHDSIVIDGARTKNLEGFLFPSTYLIPLGASPKMVEDILTAQMRKELPPGAAQKARAHGLTIPQVVTLASLIEREAKADDERPLMAGVYYNRLRLGMPLEVDATIEYALPEHHDVITYGDLKIDSPYNSYLHQGLPPTPIANPGEASLQAAFNPKPSPYLYYVYKGNGHHAFARTLAEQNANIAKYLK